VNELFLDDTAIYQSSNITRSIIRPTRASDTIPIIGDSYSGDTDSRAWESISVSPGFSVVDPDDGLIKCLYRCRGASDTTSHICYAEINPTTHAVTRPNLGIITYGGNTNNNIIIDVEDDLFGVNNLKVEYLSPFLNPSPTSGDKWLAVSNMTDSEGWLYPSILASDDLKTWTLEKNIATHVSNQVMVTLFFDETTNKWYIPFQTMDGGIREISLYRSDTSDYTGAWTNLGVIIHEAGANNQKYWAHLTKAGDTYVLIINTYSLATEKMDRFELYTSPDLSTWTVQDTSWMSLWAADGDWGYGLLMLCDLIDLGSQFEMVYAATHGLHNESSRYPTGISYATLAKYRMAQIAVTGGSGEGYIISTLQSNPNGYPLTINANSAAGNRVEVELLDVDNQIITGYERASCNTVDGNDDGIFISWGRNMPPITQDFKIKTYISNSAKLYGCSLVAPVSIVSGDFVLTGTDITVSAPESVHTVSECSLISPGGLVKLTGTDSAKFDLSLDNISWDSSITIDSGEQTFYIGVTPQDGDYILSATLGIPQ